MRASSTQKSFRRVLTEQEHGLSGVPVFACAKGKEAVLPMIEHRHKDKYECVLLGEGTRILTAGGLPYTVYPENAFFTHPDEPHAADFASRHAGEMLWFQLSAQGPFLGMGPEEQKFVRRLLSDCRARMFSVSPDVYAMFRESFRLLSRNGTASMLKGRALFTCALIALLESPAAVPVLSPEIDRAKLYILSHLQEGIDPDDLRNGSGLSRMEFEKRFMEQIGFVPKEYILRLKIEAAARDIAQGRHDFADIAFGYHFSSTAYFKTLFKRYMGVSPKQYRAKQGKQRFLHIK